MIISEVPVWVWAYIGIIVGVAARTLIPYFQSLHDNPLMEFQWRYLGTAFGSAIVSGCLMMPIFNIPNAAPYQIVFTAALFAYTTNELANRRVEKYAPVKIRKLTREKRLKKN
jgi:predicted aconitase